MAAHRTSVSSKFLLKPTKCTAVAFSDYPSLDDPPPRAIPCTYYMTPQGYLMGAISQRHTTTCYHPTHRVPTQKSAENFPRSKCKFCVVPQQLSVATGTPRKLPSFIQDLRGRRYVPPKRQLHNEQCTLRLWSGWG